MTGIMGIAQFKLGNKRNAVLVFCSPPCPNLHPPEHNASRKYRKYRNPYRGRSSHVSIFERGGYVGLDERGCRPDRRGAIDDDVATAMREMLEQVEQALEDEDDGRRDDEVVYLRAVR